MFKPSASAWVTLAATVFAVALVLPAWRDSRASEAAIAIPAPTQDEPASGTSETAVFAGGCFWGVQGVFQHVKGVTKAVSGYAGGVSNTARYEQVSDGDTGHAESVQVTFDPQQVTYGQLLQIYFSVAHDPTQLNRQGPDRGTQYRSTVFPTSASQQKVAADYIAQLNRAQVYSHALATTIEMDKPFYPAEAYHQNYLANNPGDLYIRINDLPKVEHLKQLFPQQYRETPTLVATALR